MIRKVRNHQFSTEESYSRDGMTKNSSTLALSKNTKIEDYATSHLKSDNEGEP